MLHRNRIGISFKKRREWKKVVEDFGYLAIILTILIIIILIVSLSFWVQTTPKVIFSRIIWWSEEVVKGEIKHLIKALHFSNQLDEKEATVLFFMFKKKLITHTRVNLLWALSSKSKSIFHSWRGYLLLSLISLVTFKPIYYILSRVSTAVHTLAKIP